jgi:predicted MFS family arabinose efflux permease
MMAHSSSTERDFLFSVNASLNIGVAGLSKSIGSLLPGILAIPLGTDVTSALAYRATFGVVGLLLLAAILPLLRVPRRAPHTREDDQAQTPAQVEEERSAGERPVVGGRYSARLARLLAPIARRAPEPWRSVAQDPLPLIVLLLPPLIISLGAALLIPYLNIFLIERHQASNTTLGLILAGGDIIAGAAMLAAPLFSARLGKIGAIVLTQLLSIPFLLLTGFAPGLAIAGAALVVRFGLFNLGVPLYDAFAMESSPPAARPVVIGLVNGAYALGYLVAPSISTAVQQFYGFAPLFIATACCYVLAALVMYALFGRAAVSLPQRT